MCSFVKEHNATDVSSSSCEQGFKTFPTQTNWISVLGLDHCPATGDITGLQESWESLLDSGRHVTFQIVKELALNHRVLSRKGLMHLDSGFKVDHASRVTPKFDSKYVMRLDAVIRATGVKCQLSFKQDVYTYLGIVSWLAAPVFVWACVLGYCPAER
uniref:Uncharacterized protein n=1 Tax=Oncorhynchus kisutch TaxID=8019 RepID=A0A8C7IFB2_ONCKI